MGSLGRVLIYSRITTLRVLLSAELIASLKSVVRTVSHCEIFLLLVPAWKVASQCDFNSNASLIGTCARRLPSGEPSLVHKNG
jgi:hypothetical protein